MEPHSERHKLSAFAHLLWTLAPLSLMAASPLDALINLLYFSFQPRSERRRLIPVFSLFFPWTLVHSIFPWSLLDVLILVVWFCCLITIAYEMDELDEQWEKATLDISPPTRRPSFASTLSARCYSIMDAMSSPGPAIAPTFHGSRNFDLFQVRRPPLFLPFLHIRP